MQSMFDTVETENQLSFAEKLHFRVLNSEYSIENKAILVIKYVYTQYNTAIILFSIGAMEVIAI